MLPGRGQRLGVVRPQHPPPQRRQEGDGISVGGERRSGMRARHFGLARSKFRADDFRKVLKERFHENNEMRCLHFSVLPDLESLGVRF